jgi:hypothetical protein
LLVVESWDFLPSSQCFFCEGKVELLPLGENVLMPGQLSVEVEAEIFDFIGLGKLNIIDFSLWEGCT